MDLRINRQFTRRRVKSESLWIADDVKYAIKESRTGLHEMSNTYEEPNYLQHAVNQFVLNINSEEIDYNSTCINYVGEGIVESNISKAFDITHKSKKFSFEGDKLQMKCSLNLNINPVEYDREFGFIVTSNRFLKTCYGDPSFSNEFLFKHISNKKEVLINEDKDNPFYSYSSSWLVRAGTSPPHNIELELNYSIKFSFSTNQNGFDLKKINFNGNLLIYLTIRICRRNECWEYFPAHVVQFYSFLSYDVEKVFRSSHKCGSILSHDVHGKRAFPLDILRYPNMQNGEFVLSKESSSDKWRIESIPNDLMDLTEEEFRNKCKRLFNM